MRTPIAAIAVVSIPLILGAAAAFAGEPEFRSPATDLAHRTQPLLVRAARAVNAEVPRAGNVSNLWLYPTAERDMVFAQYVVTTDTVSEQHFELLKLKSGRIVEQSDLTRVGDDVALRAKRANDTRDWSASIGTGHATSAPVTTAPTAGSPAAPHWSASIGTGRIGDDSNRRTYATASAPAAHVPNAHWTSKIGSARAADSTTNLQNGKATS